MIPFAAWLWAHREQFTTSRRASAISAVARLDLAFGEQPRMLFGDARAIGDAHDTCLATAAQHEYALLAYTQRILHIQRFGAQTIGEIEARAHLATPARIVSSAHLRACGMWKPRFSISCAEPSAHPVSSIRPEIPVPGVGSFSTHGRDGTGNTPSASGARL